MEEGEREGELVKEKGRVGGWRRWMEEGRERGSY